MYTFFFHKHAWERDRDVLKIWTIFDLSVLITKKLCRRCNFSFSIIQRLNTQSDPKKSLEGEIFKDLVKHSHSLWSHNVVQRSAERTRRSFKGNKSYECAKWQKWEDFDLYREQIGCVRAAFGATSAAELTRSSCLTVMVMLRSHTRKYTSTVSFQFNIRICKEQL